MVELQAVLSFKRVKFSPSLFIKNGTITQRFGILNTVQTSVSCYEILQRMHACFTCSAVLLFINNGHAPMQKDHK